MSLLNSSQNSTDYIQTGGFSPCTLFPDLLPPNQLADLLTIYSHVTIKTTLSPHLSQCCGPSSIFVWITEYCIQTVIRILRAGNYNSGLDCGLFCILHTFYSRAIIQRTIVDYPAFLEHSLAEKIAVCALTLQKED
jgi:hypothetical protein